MFAELLPGVEVIERWAPPDPDVVALHPEEAAVVAQSIPARRAEFLTARRLAHEALAQLGHSTDGPIGRDGRHGRRPVWPPGIVGSITHGAGLCAVVVARVGTVAGRVRGIGIDVERDEQLDAPHAALVLTEAERTAGAEPIVAFAAKEAVFKAVNPCDGTWLELGDLDLDLEGGRIEVRRSSVPLPGVVWGAWRRGDGRVRSACVLT